MKTGGIVVGPSPICSTSITAVTRTAQQHPRLPHPATRRPLSGSCSGRPAGSPPATAVAGHSRGCLASPIRVFLIREGVTSPRDGGFTDARGSSGARVRGQSSSPTAGEPEDDTRGYGAPGSRRGRARRHLPLHGQVRADRSAGPRGGMRRAALSASRSNYEVVGHCTSAGEQAERRVSCGARRTPQSAGQRRSSGNPGGTSRGAAVVDAPEWRLRVLDRSCRTPRGPPGE